MSLLEDLGYREFFQLAKPIWWEFYEIHTGQCGKDKLQNRRFQRTLPPGGGGFTRYLSLNYEICIAKPYHLYCWRGDIPPCAIKNPPRSTGCKKKRKKRYSTLVKCWTTSCTYFYLYLLQRCDTLFESWYWILFIDNSWNCHLHRARFCVQCFQGRKKRVEHRGR
jgi:hypothetical protein